MTEHGATGSYKPVSNKLPQEGQCVCQPIVLVEWKCPLPSLVFLAKPMEEEELEFRHHYSHRLGALAHG